MVSRFDPVHAHSCRHTCRVPYMSPFLAASEEAIFNAFFSSINLTIPTGALAQLELQVCCTHSSNLTTNPGPYPIILFGPGLNTTRLFYSATAAQIASFGYTVLTLDHPYETDIVEFPDGTVIYGGNVVGDLNNTAPLLKALDIRSTDARFVLDVLGVPFATETEDGRRARVGYVGQSFGGAAAAAAMLNDTRIVGGVNLDGYMFGPVLNAGIGRPGIHQSFLLWGSVGHNSSSDPSWGRFLETVRRWDPQEWVLELSLAGSNHGSSGDFGTIADVAGWRRDKELIDAFCGEILGSRAMEIFGAYIDAFMQMTLRGEGEGLLAGPDEEFPEVLFL
jgi:hypothetical protein